jgi:dTDP-4-dehydrorhamnose reductase
MKIMILGSNGQLGSELAKNISCSKILALTKESCDITNYKLIENKINEFKPDFVINAAAYTDVDGAEKFFKVASIINNDAVKNLALLSNKYNFYLMHFSTDYVFNSKNNIPIQENDIKNPINKYGESKLLGENNIIDIANKYIILRVSWVYGEVGNNFPKTIIKLAKEKNEISVVNDQYGAPTSTKLITLLVKKIINKYNSGYSDSQIFHLSPNGICSWYEISNFIFDHLKNNEVVSKNTYLLKKINPVSSSFYKTIAKRPSFSYLCNNKLANFLDYRFDDWKQHLREFLEKEILL